MNWEYYVSRRRINVSEWLKTNGIHDRDSFLSRMQDLHIKPPSDEQLLSMWPEPVQIAQKEAVEIVEMVEETKEPENNEYEQHAAERVSQASTWGVAGQSSADYQRSSGKQSNKLQGRGDRRGR